MAKCAPFIPCRHSLVNINTKKIAARACPESSISMISTTPKSGFRVPYEVRSSTIAGRGVFATEPVKRGTLVWAYVVHESVIEHHTEAELRKHLAPLSNDEARDKLEHIYVWGDAGVEIIDDAKIWNHSPNPNTGNHPDTGESLGSYALRDIAAGEEFTDDYGNHHELPWFEALCKEYQCTSCTDLGKRIR